MKHHLTVKTKNSFEQINSKSLKKFIIERKLNASHHLKKMFLNSYDEQQKEPTFDERPVIVFDLDDTLVYISALKTKEISYPIMIGKRRRAYVHFRPGLQEFLKEVVSMNYEVFIFTSITEKIGNQIIDLLMHDLPHRNRLFRDSCKVLNGYYVKDLNLINRKLEHILIVDDSQGSAMLQPENLVRVTPWYGNMEDEMLMKQLLPVIEKLKYARNMPDSFLKLAIRKNYSDIHHFVSLE